VPQKDNQGNEVASLGLGCQAVKQSINSENMSVIHLTMK